MNLTLELCDLLSLSGITLLFKVWGWWDFLKWMFFFSSKNPRKMHHGFHKNINQHNCFRQGCRTRMAQDNKKTK